jgi:hypothetical protein
VNKKGRLKQAIERGPHACIVLFWKEVAITKFCNDLFLFHFNVVFVIFVISVSVHSRTLLSGY